MDAIGSGHGRVATDAVARPWVSLGSRVLDAVRRHQADPARVVVLVPAAAHIPWAAAAWREVAGDGLAPRIETAQTWALRLGSLPSQPGEEAGLLMDRGLDLLKAAQLLRQAGLRDLSRVGAARLLDAAIQVCAPLRAVAPARRADWLAQALAVTAADADVLHAETALARLALHWASASVFPTDVLWSEGMEQKVDLLLVVRIPGLDPLHQALATRFGDRAVTLDWPEPAPREAAGWGHVALHACADADDEAQRAAACVIAHLRQGHRPVALLAQDRLLVRRVRALLELRGVSMHDETGWKLSTTAAAAALMSLLRVGVPHVTCDAVLAFLKHAHAHAAAPGEPPLDADVAAAPRELEAWLRKEGISTWRRGLTGRTPPAVARLVSRVDELRDSLHDARALPAWLADIARVMGEWPGLRRLAEDAAGADVLRVLRIGAGAPATPWLSRRMSVHEFMAWAADVLEASGFRPPGGVDADVVIASLGQLPGRPVAALVAPGCDETHLPAAPVPAGDWTRSQRQALGLPDRPELRQEVAWAWRQALQLPHCDLLWRHADQGETCLPSPLVRLLDLQRRMAGQAVPDATEPRVQRRLPAVPEPLAAPSAAALMPAYLSASAYADLRACPYRFFALRLLGLAPADELDSELDKRDFGNWLHLVLSRYHSRDAGTGMPTYSPGPQSLDLCAESARRDMALDEAEFLPFATIWPAVRQAYLEWQAGREMKGWQVMQVESPGRREVFAPGQDAAGGAPLTVLRGRIDRVDHGEQDKRCVIDYKTESITRSRARLAQPHEDTQLAFYAALLDGGEELQGGYLNLSDRDGATWLELPGLAHWKSQLMRGIGHDLQRLAQGASLKALGEGSDCDYCQARGLCRKDFRRAAQGPDDQAAPAHGTEEPL